VHAVVDEPRPLAITVGCTFGFETPQPVSAVLQVAPGPEHQVRAERWDTGADHHGYVDLYGNRCERFTIAAGASRIVYDAEVVLSTPGDQIAPGTPETPIMALPDEHIAFVMPSRFCLPDELGHEAWQRFGDVTPGWERVQAIVDFVHGHLEWVAGASNPWTTAIDAYRAGQGVCRDFAHLAITFCRALNIPARYVFGYIPDIDVPTSTWFGSSTGASFCFIAGHEVPLSQATLDELYPSHGVYVRAVVRNVHGLVARRLLTVADGLELIREAARSDVP